MWQSFAIQLVNTVKIHYKPAGNDITSSPAITISVSPVSGVTRLGVSAALVTFSVDDGTRSHAKERGKDTVIEVTDGRFLVAVHMGSDVGTARRSTGGDDKGAGTARRNTGGDKGPAAAVFPRRRRTKDGTRRVDMRRTDDDDWPLDEVTTAKYQSANVSPAVTELITR